jgi:hypothetical protein
MGDIPESLIQLGASATIALYLIYYLTRQIKGSIDANTTALISLNLMTTEVYRTMLVIKALDISPEDSATEHCKKMATLYHDVQERIKQLQTEIVNLRDTQRTKL